MSDYDQPLSPQAGRYRLIWGALCPYAHRARIALAILGLEDVISLGVTHPVRTDKGWRFDGRDPVLGIEYLQEAYHVGNPHYTGPYSVPALVDTITGGVVRKESAEILHELATDWRVFHKEGAPNLYPDDLGPAIDQLNQELAEAINDGVYKMGFAENQADYDVAFHRFFNQLEVLDQRLATQRYLHGDRLTESDIRLYTTLVRFDAVYYVLYKANGKRLVDYPHLWPYMRDLYQTPGFGSTTDFEVIKRGYFNTSGIIPLGPDTSVWQLPHQREQLG